MTSQITSRYSAEEATAELWNLAVTDDITRLEHLVACGADINARNDDGVTALMRASATGHLAMAMALIGRGAEINAQRVDGFTPLMLASFFGHADVVKALVQHGADPGITNRFGTSAEMWATTRSFHDIANYLQAALEATPETPLPVIPEEDAWSAALYPQNISEATSVGFEPEFEAETEPPMYAEPEAIPEEDPIAEEPIVSEELFMAEEIVVAEQRAIAQDGIVEEAERRDVSAAPLSQRMSIDESAFDESADESASMNLFSPAPTSRDLSLDDSAFEDRVVAQTKLDEPGPRSLGLIIDESAFDEPGDELSSPAQARDLVLDEAAFDNPVIAEASADEHGSRKPVSRGLIIDESALDEPNDESHTAQLVSPAPVSRGLIVDESAYEDAVITEPPSAERSPKPVSRGLIVDESAYEDFEEPAFEEHVVQTPVPQRLLVDDSVFEESIVDQPNSEPRSSRLLTDPPEIWDMVHESTVEFRPGFAFVTRMTSGWTNIALLLLVIGLVTGGGTFAFLKFRNGGFQNLSTVAESKKPQTSVIPKPKPAERKSEIVTPAPQPTAAPVESVSPAAPPFAATADATVEPANTKPPTAKPSLAPRVNTAVIASQPSSKTPEVAAEPVVRETTTVPSGARAVVQKQKPTPKSSPPREEREVARAVSTDKPQVEPRDSEPTGTKVASTEKQVPRVSEPPPKSPSAPAPASQPKAKVIQWP